jgi:ABC-type bacteriocin/lantibiotic exporter with double-glycine peptidase domain
MKSGAGGNWQRLDEKFDGNIIRQTSGISCVSAVGEMLLREQEIVISQEKIRDIIGEPADIESLAMALNKFDFSDDDRIWRGHTTDEKSLEIIFRLKSFGVFLVEDYVLNRLLHAVFVHGKTQNGLVKIQDTFDQTSYKMRMKDFLKHWGGQVIYKW